MGPSLNSYNGAKCYAKDDFGIKLEKKTININTSPFGKVDERVIDVAAEATLTPEGRWSNALIAAWFTPFANMIRGTSLLGIGSDLPFVASANDGEVHTIASAAITKLPDIFLSAKKTLLGSMTFKGYRILGSNWTTASSLYTVTTGGSVVDATFAPSKIVVQPYTAVWGSIAGFTTVDTEEGWTISFNIHTKEIETDTAGTLDVRFQGIEIMAKCVPVGPTSANVLQAANIQGLSGTNGMNRGYSLNNDGSGGVVADLVITGADGVTAVTVKAANIKGAGYEFGATKLREGEIGFVATRTFSAGAQQAIFSLVAPS